MYSTSLGALPKLTDLELTEELVAQYREIIEISEEVKRTLGEGYWEEIYRSALALEFRLRGEAVGEEVGKDVLYKEEVIGRIRADIVVYGAQGFLVEVKRGDLSRAAWQLAAYLKTFDTPVGYVVGFSQNKLTVYLVAMLPVEGVMRCILYDGKNLSEMEDVGK